MSIKKICVVTGSRAEYGLIKPLLMKLKDDQDIKLQLVVTGMHLKEKFGFTINEIEEDNFDIFKKIDIMPDSNNHNFLSESLSKGIEKFSKFFSKNKPHLLIVLGDRFEILSCSISAYFLNIPIGHINGGETTEAAFDEGIRHSISKMSYLHFPSTELYRKRIIQLGESPERVYNVGGLFIDSIKNSDILSREDLENKTGITFQNKNLLVTYHPETLNDYSNNSLDNLLKALEDNPGLNYIFTAPNADPGNDKIFDKISSFVNKNQKKSILFKSLGHKNYISCLNQVDGIIGNSSSGITEAPYFKIGTINIGKRQGGRIRAKSIIDCDSSAESISKSIDTLYSDDFQSKLKSLENPYGDGTAAYKILEIIKKHDLPKNIKKKFFDINFSI
tara:strand:+ start:3692 stop:4861 length:1170 start_codon:yes stop_codon:yes gene_type:complete